MAERQRVVVVGAGFGGLEVVRALRHAAVAVTVIDRENHHTFQPLLYQVATAALAAPDVAWPVRGMLRGQANARVVMADVTGVNAARREVITDRGTFGYDWLVLATGATHSYFGHDSWEPFAPALKRVADAQAIRQRLLLAFEQAELAPDKAGQQRLLSFVVVGGGPTGVEMAGAIAEVARDTLRHDFRKIDPAMARVVLVEAGPRVLPSFPEDLSAYALGALGRMGVEVQLTTMVTGCDAMGVDTAHGRIEAATLIWAAGVRASPAARWLGVEADRAGRVHVAADLSVPGFPEVFAIGDTALVMQENGKPVPGVAPSAKQMGRYVGRQLASRARGLAITAPFRYKDEGELATIGRKAAVVRVGRLKLTGFAGWLFWCLVHVMFLVTLQDRIVVSLKWLWNYITFHRSARIVTRPDDQPMVTHTMPAAAAGS